MTMALAVAAGPAKAGPYTEVASAFDEGDRFDLTFALDYQFAIRRAEIKREFSGLTEPPVAPTDPLPVVKDLLFSGNRHVLIPRLELGVFTDLSLSAALPVVIADSRELEFDGRTSPRIDRNNSTTIVDGLLPANGFDADDVNNGFADGSTIFRGPNRSGLDQIHLGLAWAPMNQSRDDTKPTWKIGAEVRLAIGSPMKLDRSDPSRENSVGRGVHEIRIWTSMAKRVGWAEPFVEIWWMAPVDTAEDSAFADLGFGQNRANAQQRAGTKFGFQAIAWDNPEDNQRISIDFSARLEAHFEGRAYTSMWEVFQFAGDASATSTPLVLDGDPVTTGAQPLSHPGVTNVENYLRFGGRIGLDTMLGETIRFGGAFELLAAQDHLITYADAGTDSDDAGEIVNTGTAEVNPAHVPLIDLVGNRYRVEEAIDYIFLVDARVLF